MNLFDQALHSNMASKLAAIRVIVLFDSQQRAEVIEHPNDLGCMPFGLGARAISTCAPRAAGTCGRTGVRASTAAKEPAMTTLPRLPDRLCRDLAATPERSSMTAVGVASAVSACGYPIKRT